MTDMEQLFSEWLQHELEKRNWRQIDLANATGLTRTTISRYINQSRNMPELESIALIAKAFGYSPDVIFTLFGLIPI